MRASSGVSCRKWSSRAWPVDGRQCFHAGPRFRCGVRLAQQLDGVPGGHGSFHRRGHQHGFSPKRSRDDGVLSGRGHPWTRGLVCGAMTTAGGIGHTLPFSDRQLLLRHVRGRGRGRG